MMIDEDRLNEYTGSPAADLTVDSVYREERDKKPSCR